MMNTVLVECPVCTGQVASDAKSCPHCGHPLIKSNSKWLCDIGGFFTKAQKRIKSHNNASERCHDPYREYVMASWGAIACQIFICLIILLLAGLFGLLGIGKFALLIAIVRSIRMIPTKARYNKLKQFLEARARVFENFDPTAKTVVCPVCGEEISVDFIKCPECKLEIGRIIDDVRKAKASR